MAVAMNRMGTRSSSGEGGEDPAHYRPSGTDRLDSRIMQVASARFGVTMEYLVRADEIEIKIVQGAKPGEGGQLPAHKVTELIVLVAGHVGGTSASPLSSIKHAGAPWELGLAESQHVLVANGLRHRLEVRVDGGFRTGRDVVIAAMLGAEWYCFGTGPLVAIGCDMARQCHLNSCPSGIATQTPELRAKFRGNPDQVVAYFTHVAQQVRAILASIGARTIGEIVGASEPLAAIRSAWTVRLQALLDDVAPPFPARALQAPVCRPD